MNTEPNDKELMKAAKARVAFKTHFMIFIMGNILIWLIWLMMYYVFEVTFPWALFPTIGWGVGLAFHFFIVFKWNEKWVEKEYQRLKTEKEGEADTNNIISNQNIES
ncbi:MAG: 2TM domain-containing protein [Bacteroidales bacterium]|nr:2TM domain-containing protein [Bacteroidales bacterium]